MLGAQYALGRRLARINRSSENYEHLLELAYLVAEDREVRGADLVLDGVAVFGELVSYTEDIGLLEGEVRLLVELPVRQSREG